MTISVIVLSSALFLAMVVNLAAKPKFSARLTTWLMVFCALAGIYIYGTGYAEATGDVLLSVVKVPFTVTRMFVGVNDLSGIAGTRFVSTQAGILAFWVIQLLAFYTTASAVMISLGAEALRHLRSLLSLRGELTLIYGLNDNCINVGKECRSRGSSVVFVTEEDNAALVSQINNLGMSVVSGMDAVNPDKSFIRKMHIAKRKLSVYAMVQDRDENLYYALRLKAALEQAGVPTEQTQLTLPGAEDIITNMLQVSEESYGFGYVHVFDEASLAARSMLRLCPPWDFMTFDKTGRAQQDFECAVIGFGRFGQAAFRQLLMNGQYAGSNFRAAVFSTIFENESGYFLTDCPSILKEYQVEFFSADGRSRLFYDYLSKHLKTLKYIVVSTGNDAMNNEITDHLMLFLQRNRAERICVVQCGQNGARYQEAVGSPILNKKIYTVDLLSPITADRNAIILNAGYDTSDRSPWEKWVACDTFSKMSSRASAEFIPGIIKASGFSEEEVENGSWQPTPELLEVLGQTEHMRWCAFHYAMGYNAMSKKVFDARAAYYLDCVKQGIPCSPRFAKDSETRVHACLVPWEELDELSARENAVNGRNVDYKQLDINNIIAIPQLLRAQREAGSLK